MPLARLFRIVQGLLLHGLQHETASVRAQLRVLRDTKADVLRTLATVPPSAYRVAQLGAVLDAIDRTLAPHQTTSETLAADAARAAYAIGRAQAAATLPVSGMASSSTISTGLLQAVIDVTTDQIRDVWGELGSGLKANIRRVALGAQDADTAIASVARMVRDPRTFGTAATRAEVIIGTEVNRTYSVAADARFRELDEVFDGLRKGWIAAKDGRVRASHREAGRIYAPGGDPGPIPIAQSFHVGRARLRYPLDPLGPAKEVIKCRCRMIAIPPTTSAAEWAVFTEEFDHVQEHAAAEAVA